MSIKDTFGFGKAKYTDPAAAAQPYLSQIPQVGHQTYDPYVNRGNQAANTINPLYERFATDPRGYLDELMSGYEPSQGYQKRKEELTRAAGNTAAAGGYRGTPSDIRNQTEIVNGLLSEDMQQFLQNIFGIQNTGLQGEQGFSNTGFNASNNLADIVGNSLNQQGGLAFQSARQKNEYEQENQNRKQQFWLNLLGALGGTAKDVAVGFL